MWPTFRLPAEGAHHDRRGNHPVIIVGLILGALGRRVLPGRRPSLIWLTVTVGVTAAFIGSFIAGALGYANANGRIPWTC